MKKVEIWLRKLLLKLAINIGGVYTRKKSIIFDKNSKILLIRLNKIGDALVTTPFIKILKENTGSQIHVLADKKNHFVFENNLNIDNVIVFRKSLPSILQIVKLINKHKFDAVVDLHDDISTTVTYIISLLNIPNKFGLSKGNESVYTKTVRRITPSKYHIIERNLELLKLFGINFADYDSVNIEYNFGNSAKLKAKEFVNSINPENNILIGINISAGSDARFWGINNYKKLLSDLSNHNYRSVILCSPNDFNTAEFIAKDKYPIFESNHFDEIAAIISKLDFLFTPDTAVVHLASAYRIPVFGLYVKYKTKDVVWYPYKSKYDLIITEESTLINLDYNNIYKRLMEFINKNEFNSEHS